MFNLTKNISKTFFKNKVLTNFATYQAKGQHRKRIVSFYQQLKNEDYMKKSYRSYGLKFANQGLRLVIYPMYPKEAHE